MDERRSTNFPPSGIEFHYGYSPGLLGRIGELHGRYYLQTLGWGAGFEIVVLRGLCDFLDGYSPALDLILTAQIDGRLIGSVFILGRKNLQAGAQLRFFLVDPAYRGQGVGTRLLTTALSWTREIGFARIFLWTVYGLTESRNLYEKNGFQVVERIRDDRFSTGCENLKMEMILD